MDIPAGQIDPKAKEACLCRATRVHHPQFVGKDVGRSVFLSEWRSVQGERHSLRQWKWSRLLPIGMGLSSEWPLLSCEPTVLWQIHLHGQKLEITRMPADLHLWCANPFGPDAVGDSADGKQTTPPVATRQFLNAALATTVAIRIVQN